MNIGLDIDGCMTNFSDELKVLLENEYNVSNVKTDTYHMLQQIGIYSIEDQRLFFDKHKDYFNKQESKDGCAKVINLLNSNRNNNIYILTARSYDEASSTEEWLRKNSIIQNNIYFNCENKLGVCKWKKIDVMIEDSPYNAMDLANNGIKVLLMDTDYNRNITHKNIFRCYNWDQVYLKIKELY